MARKNEAKFLAMPYEELLIAVCESNSVDDLQQRLGYQSGGSALGKLLQRLEQLNISIEHFVTRGPGTSPIPFELVLIKDSPYNYTVAKRAYIRLRLKPYQCTECGQLPLWNSKELVLVFDHKNGDNRDHRPSNLRWLCPNCNSQQETFAGKNIKNPLRRGKNRD